MKKEIIEKIEELELEKMVGYESWVYEGDTYKDKNDQETMYCVINGADNEGIDIPKDEHLYKIETGDEVDNVSLILVV